MIDWVPGLWGVVVPADPEPTKCVITGLPAKYKDPLTGQPYATIQAFKEIRKQHAAAAASVEAS